ncbi:hypothetical protein BD309DRAFT_575345 [Dichomitus squalens]|uniref:Uncharacterized protein n=1 Tax=Dichomitus squalens TaxID=114155 RepID=A0A4Q9MMJ3_9APHY|nr:hypothetical protein BD311DRAFT_304701 [Dichomitus squalens]TBU50100.1 hypothetical protein BD309DRAFT_575345 [Dichomitus squalens]
MWAVLALCQMSGQLNAFLMGSSNALHACAFGALLLASPSSGPRKDSSLMFPALVPNPSRNREITPLVLGDDL